MESSALPSATAMALTLRNYNFANNHDVTAIVEDPNLADRVGNIRKSFSTIDVLASMKNLVQVGTLLQLAYAGSKRFPCNEHVVGICCDYQTFIKDSFLTMKDFERVCLKALRKHKVAVLHAEKNQFEKALETISQCSELAENMAKSSKKLAKKAENLCVKSKEALLAATRDENISEEKRKEIQKKMTELDAREAYLKQLTRDLTTQISEEKVREAKNEENEKSARKNALIVQIVSVAMGPIASLGSALAAPIQVGLGVTSQVLSIAAPITAPFAGPITATINASLNAAIQKNEKNKKDLEEIEIDLAAKGKLLEQAKEKGDKDNIAKLEVELTVLEAKRDGKNKEINSIKESIQNLSNTFSKEADYYRKKSEMSAQTRANLQKQEREANADLAASIQTLKHLNIETNTLDQAVASLELSVKTLGKIKTVFENARLYFKQVGAHCKELKELASEKNFTELSSLGEDICKDALLGSALNWCVLCDDIFKGVQAIENVNHHIDSIMTNLPTKEESIKLINSIEILGIQNAVTHHPT